MGKLILSLHGSNSQVGNNLGSARQPKSENLMFSPGQEVSGKVTLNLKTKTFVRGLWIKFSGFNTIHLNSSLDQELTAVRGKSQAPSKRGEPKSDRLCIDLLAKEEDHHLGGLHIVLMGKGEEVIPEEDEALLEVAAGVTEHSFCFVIPKDAPLTYHDKHVLNAYFLTVNLDSPTVSRPQTEISHHLAVGVVESVGSDLSHTSSSSSSSSTSSSSATTTSEQAQPSISAATLPVLGMTGSETIKSTEIIDYDRNKFFLFPFLCRPLASKSRSVSIAIQSLSGPPTFEFRSQNTALNLKIVTNQILKRSDYPETHSLALEVELRAESILFDYPESLASCLVESSSRRKKHPPHQTNTRQPSSDDKRKEFHRDIVTLWKTQVCARRRNSNASPTVDSPSSPTLTNRSYINEITVPIMIDPSVRTAALEEWPLPGQHMHEPENFNLTHFTTNGPLYNYRVCLVVTAYSFPSIHYPTMPLDKCIKSKGSKHECGCVTEILINPPTRSSQSPSLSSSAAIPVSTTSTSQSSQRSEVLSSSTLNRPPRPVPTHSVINPHTQNNSQPMTALTPSRLTTTSISSSSPSSFSSIANPNPNPTKILTPQASLAIPSVCAEPVSLGPAAVLVDRNNNRTEHPYITPRRYSSLCRLAAAEALPLDCTPDYSPQLAYLYDGTEDDVANMERRGAALSSSRRLGERNYNTLDDEDAQNQLGGSENQWPSDTGAILWSTPVQVMGIRRRSYTPQPSDDVMLRNSSPTISRRSNEASSSYALAGTSPSISRLFRNSGALQGVR